MSDAYMKFYHEFLQKKNTFTDGGSSGGGGDEGESKLPKEKEQKKGTLKLSKEKKDKVDQHLSSSDMEHSYTRDLRPQPVLTGLAPARTLLVRRPPQCPSCHTHPADENNDGDDANQPIVPSYNETAAKDAMNECARIAKSVKNANSDDQNWEERVSQSGWSSVQSKLFEKVVSILDSDQLGRLANTGRPHEPVQRRVVVDKSAQRMRKALASVQWEPRITQWLHGLLMECLPPSYMASYLDILQTLKAKLPTLIDKMLFGRPMNTSQELLAPVLKKQWEPTLITQKSRKLPQPAVIIALPSMPISGPVPSRIQKWYQHLATITQIVQVTLPSGSSMAKQPLDNIAEQIVSLTRLKIQELRNEQSSRNIILIGFNAGAALALQVAMVENVSSVVCMGLAFNTLNGVRGTPDDRILDIKVPILFVVGQNSARSSQEEIESLREKMHSDSALVVVGSADDVLRVPKSKRKIENVTQSMVDTMVIDEVYEFIKKIILHPPGPRTPIVNTNIQPPVTTIKKVSPADTSMNQRKRKQQNTPTDAEIPRKTKFLQDPFLIKRKVGRPRTRPLPPEISSVPQSTPVKPPPIKQTPQIIQQPSNDDLNLAIQSILGDGDTPTKASDESRSEVTNFEIVTQPKSAHIKTILGSGMRAGQALSLGTGSNTKIKMIPSNQFVQLKPPIQSQTKIYTIKPTSLAPSPTTSAPTVSGSQIFTIKPNTSVNQAQIMSVGGQSKFTILKTSPIKTGLGSTTIASSSSNTTTTNDLTNIFDMPIIFADNDGNLTESVSISKAPITTSTPIVLTQPSVTQNKGGTYVINTSALQQQQQQQLQQQQQKPKTNKVVFINRNTMKPCPNIISRSPNVPQLQKYAKVVVKNPNTSTSSLVSRPAQTQQLIKTSDRIIKPLNLHGIKSTSPLASSVTPTMPSTSSPGILNLKQFQIVNMDPDKKKFIKSIPPTTQNTTTTATITGNVVAAGAVVGSPQTLNKTVFIKQSGLKPLPDHLKPQFLAKNVTVRKLVNLVPTAKTSGVITTTVSQLQSGAAAATANSTAINSGSVVTPTTTLSLSTILKSKHHQSM
ncbi:KAT8 regulatory NSL complex subunit 3 isoform X2 [Episyrphus balteatus]|uniref:KAT8 regulatory NSL complex subunit 3 isoform X2 n=1 Tax=Episyrphus balteatus TaxID=286459 RepID=UPI0024869C9F|nr:KAT8 regulatory NSL complex subunit 3 isoform X2 [Episyrphus balteatus]